MAKTFFGRRTRGRSPNLQQQILHDTANISTGTAPGLINQVTEIAKEVGDVIIRLLILDLIGVSSGSTALDMVRCAVLSKPRSEGVPIAADMDDPKYIIARYGGHSGITSAPFHYHWRQNMGIKVPSTNDVYIACQSDNDGTVRMGFDIRIFWQSL